MMEGATRRRIELGSVSSRCGAPSLRMLGPSVYVPQVAKLNQLALPTVIVSAPDVRATTLPLRNSLSSRQTANLLYESVMRCVRSGVSIVLKTVSTHSRVANVCGFVAVGTLSESCLSLGRTMRAPRVLWRRPPLGSDGLVGQWKLRTCFGNGCVCVARLVGIRLAGCAAL